MKSRLKSDAIRLRLNGLSYSEILKTIPIAKSTLSLWLRSVHLSKPQKQRLTDKKLVAIARGWEARRRQRIERTNLIKQNAFKDISKINKENLFLMGNMLYWAEGSKQKEHLVSQGVIFGNSDPLMIKMFLKWLKDCLGILDKDLMFDIYIHKNHETHSGATRRYWSEITGFSISKFDKIYFKKHNLSTNRRNKGDSYHGQLRIAVRRSTDLNRKITGWIEAICSQCRVV